MSGKNRFLRVVGYVCYVAFLLEVAARLVFIIPSISSSLSNRLQLWGDEDYTWHRNWVDRHQSSGTEIYYKFDIYDPSKGWISQPNLRDMKVFGDKTLNTNSKGFRGKKDYPYIKNKEMLQILILGDSFTFGDEVSDDETYSFYLQEMLPNTEVINLGVHGYGHDQMLILLKEEGVKYEPDIVILGFNFVDMPRNLLQFRDFAKPRFVLNGDELKLTGSPVPRPEDILQLDWTRPRTFDMFSLMRYKVRKLSGLHKKEMEDVTTAIVADMIELIESIHAIPILAYLPAGGEISMPIIAVTQYEAYMFSQCQLNKKAQCLSARPYFAAKISKGETFKSTGQGHWDPAGHRTVAETIKHYLVDEQHITVP